MPSFKPTSLWEAKPHTLAKIEIVRRYLYLWFSILGSNPLNKRLVYVDGFAGPGGYTNSDQSSPVAALQSARAAIERSGANLGHVEFTFLFVEKQPEFADNLHKVISATSWPGQLKWHIERGSLKRKLVASWTTYGDKDNNSLPLLLSLIHLVQPDSRSVSLRRFSVIEAVKFCSISTRMELVDSLQPSSSKRISRIWMRSSAMKVGENWIRLCQCEDFLRSARLIQGATSEPTKSPLRFPVRDEFARRPA